MRYLRPLSIALLASAAAVGAHAEQAPPTEVTIKVGAKLPEPNRVTVSTGMPLPAPAVAASAPAALGGGIPMVPASTASAPDITPAPSMPASATQAQLPSALVPGVPVKTYPTLEAAAKDGIDPLRVAAAPVRPVPAAAGKAFDFTNPQAYLDWVKPYLGTKEGVIAAAVAGGLLVLLVLRRLLGRS